MNIDKILTKEFELGELDDAAREATLERLSHALYLNLGARLAGEMNETELDNFAELVKENPDTVAQVMSQRFPNFPDIVSEEIAKLKDDFKALM